VVDAFHWALLLRIATIANDSFGVNGKNAELQKKICELKTFAGEALKV
jgi:hypothetical protein